MNYHLTMVSSNRKTGPIPVSTTSAETCADACPLKRDPVTQEVRGCYADGGPLGMHWRAVTEGKRGVPFAAFLREVEALPAGTFWRHNQAGDLPGVADALDVVALAQLVGAAKHTRGFTYTHKPLASVAEREAIREANASGFTINLSANSLDHADKLAALGIGPVAVVLDAPEGTREGTTTPEGRPVRVCPATYRDDVSCDTCRACANADRKVIIGFPAHGASKARATKVVRLYKVA